MSDTPPTRKRKAKPPHPTSALTKRFGPYVKRLRLDRGLTQEELAELADLASDSIRRIEWGWVSPTLDTIDKLARGLRLDLTALFTVFEHGDTSRERELVAMARTLGPDDLTLVLRLVVFLVGLLGGIASERSADAREDGHE